MLTYKHTRILEEEHPLIGSSNHRPLTPLEYLPWVATVYPHAMAWKYGEETETYARFYERCCKLAGALQVHGLKRGDVVAVLSPNTPMLLETHFGVPMGGQVICPISPMRDAAGVAYILEHCEAKLVIVDSGCRELAQEALALLARRPEVMEADDTAVKTKGKPLSKLDYHRFVEQGSANYEWPGPRDEWETLTISYTLGTGGTPKGVLLHHRGAYLDATGSIITNGLNHESVYLWTLPMCRASGWGYIWAVTAVGATHVLTREHQLPAEDVFRLIRRHEVTHLSGKAGFLDRLAEGVKGQDVLPHSVHLDVVQQKTRPEGLHCLEALGFNISVLYGMMETFGPAAICHWRHGDSLIGSEESDSVPQGMLAHPGAHFPTLDRIIVADPETLKPLPADGKSIGEIMLRGNTIFKGYHKAPEATEKVLRGGWFLTGDLGVIHPDGHVEILQRECDALHDTAHHVLNVTAAAEETLGAHPAVQEVAIVEHHGTTIDSAEITEPVAFIVLHEDADSGAVTEDDLLDYCQRLLPEDVCPVRIEIREELPHNEDGDILRYRLRDECA